MNDTKVTGPGLTHLKDLKKLELVEFKGINEADEGLVRLQELPNLWGLNFERSDVTDEGLKQLIGFRRLSLLSLRPTRVTDEGLIHLHQIPDLQGIDLTETQVTDAGIAELKKALPDCLLSGL